jgi:hypothetical protein
MFASSVSRCFQKSLVSRFVAFPKSRKAPFRNMCTEEGPKEKTSTVMVGKFKDLFKKYGYIFVGTYLGLYVTTLGSVYFALECDVFSASSFGYDAQTLIKKV